MKAPTPDELEPVERVLVRDLGWRVEPESRATVAEAVVARLRATHSRDCPAYVERLRDPHKGQAELHALAQLLTIGETYFFRGGDHLSAMMEEALPARMEARGDERVLRILSLGCSSGEEPYTIAMLMCEQGLSGRAHGRGWALDLRGYDLNAEYLAKARNGKYTPWSVRATAPEILAKYFRKEGGSYRIVDEIRQMVRFEERNSTDAEPFPLESFDVVFCRNMLIYFTHDAIKATIAKIERALLPGGFLFLGHSETLRDVPSTLLARSTHGTFYYQRPSQTVQAPARLPTTREPFTPVKAKAPPRAPAAAPSRAAPRKGPSAQEAPAAEASLRERALDLLKHGRHQQAATLLSSARSLDAAARGLLALALFNGGRIRDAERLASEAVAAAPVDPIPRQILALCRESEGDLQGAEGFADAAAFLDASFAYPHVQLGRLARRRGDLGKARNALGRALALLEKDDSERLVLFAGELGRGALIDLCKMEMVACGGLP